MDPVLSLTGLVVGFVVGLTGMGGGALMTPALVLLLGVPPLAAVSSDLVASAVMKPIGGAVHARRKTVQFRLVGWLMLGSVPTAFLGVFVLKALGGSDSVDHAVEIALGVALLLASSSLVLKSYMSMRERLANGGHPPVEPGEIRVRVLPTLLVGAIGGLVVGMTSVGSGSIIIIALLVLYPMLSTSQLVGTDLVQAVPLVGAAALAHLLFGDFQLDLTTSLLVGAIPGVYAGAHLSSRAPSGAIRPVLVVVLIASGLKLVGVSTTVTGVLLTALVLLGPVVWVAVRLRHGMPALPWHGDGDAATTPAEGSGSGEGSGPAEGSEPAEQPAEEGADAGAPRP
jgi:uncharacterized protein